MISVSVNRGEPDRICSDSSGSVTEMWGSVALPAGAGEAHAEKCDGERNPVGAAGSSRRHSSQHLLSGPGDRTQTGTFQFSACPGKSDAMLGARLVPRTSLFHHPLRQDVGVLLRMRKSETGHTCVGRQLHRSGLEERGCDTDADQSAFSWVQLSPAACYTGEPACVVVLR